MALTPQDIVQLARSLIADFGMEAETEVNRLINNCMEARHIVAADIWREVRSAIAEIRANPDSG
jgi:hypothetical protein